ncbi:transglutaminaseTgpA domain-containing protein [Deinococcus sp. HMF7604]|uniref:transglutaminaseTgpA domain-containing protein n=1 Tax=Deinococcus betulae TaxID=2873312 RepID=UPI001CC96FAA|nr:transglutaminaseTgpA domain-containing protein [Deinococcus betulae]MBZ9749644.1 transglutaminaseTgpA domain-containing protein [Deinococcus betulae]
MRAPPLALRPTGFGLAFLLVILLTLIGCVNYGLSLGYGLTFLLGGVWVMTATQALRAARGVRVSLAPPVAVTAGGLADFSVSFSGGAEGVLALTLRGDGAQAVGAWPLSGGVSSGTLSVPARHRGPLSVEGALRVSDRLGLWRVALPAPDPQTVLVHPAAEQGAPPAPTRTVAGSGDGAQRTRGDEEFAGLRPYAPGDSPRQVSWRHVARTGTLLTRETDAPQGRARLLDWADTAGDPEARLSRLSAWVTELTAAGLPFALHLPGARLPVDSGEAHALAARRTLALHAPFPQAVTPPRRPGLALTAAPARSLSLAQALALRGTLLALAVTLAPTALRAPVWLTALVAALLAHAAWRTRPTRPGTQPLAPLPTWLLGLLAVAGGAALNAVYGTLLGRDAGTAFLALLVALKTAESRDVRDGRLLILLGLFTTSTHYFFSQGPLTALHTLLCAALLLAAAPGWTAAGLTLTRAALRRAGGLLALAAPLAAALFVLFPRPEAPLWQLPVQGQATTGLSSEIRAGEFSNLAQSDAVAFRADFQGEPPASSARYWRGPVYEAYDGETWRQVRGGGSPASVEPTGPAQAYTLTLEPSGTPWLLALDVPSRVPDGASITGAFQAVTFRPVTTRRRVELESRPARLGRQEDANRLAFNQLLPSGQSPRARALAQTWQGLAPAARVDAALNFLRRGGFTYTLSPPTLPAQDRVDAFLFGTRTGFCEHYASAFAFLMRASGLSARVVGGYQGGESNGDYLIIRQRDAHAWTEVWLPGQGWVRVDPTAAIAPARLSAGVQTALTQPLATAALPPGPLAQLRLRLDTLQNRWNDLVVDYDGERQSDLLTRAGLGGVGQPAYLILLPVVVALTLLPALLVLRRRGRPADPAAGALHDLSARLRLPRAPGETAADYTARVSQARPDLAEPLGRVLLAYHAARYAPGDPAGALRDLKAAVRQVRR